jgi:hypothetical protein
LSADRNILEAIISILTRHPMRQDDLERAIQQHAPGSVEQLLAELYASGRVQVVQRYGQNYWSIAGAVYPTETQSQATSPERMRHRKE